MYNGYFINGEIEMSNLKITPIAVSIHRETEHPLSEGADDAVIGSDG